MCESVEDMRWALHGIITVNRLLRTAEAVAAGTVTDADAGRTLVRNTHPDLPRDDVADWFAVLADATFGAKLATAPETRDTFALPSAESQADRAALAALVLITGITPDRCEVAA